MSKIAPNSGPGSARGLVGNGESSLNEEMKFQASKVATISVILVGVIYAALLVVQSEWESSDRDLVKKSVENLDFSKAEYVGWDMVADGGTLVVWFVDDEDVKFGLFLDGRMNQGIPYDGRHRYESLYLGYPDEKGSHRFQVGGEAEQDLIHHLREVIESGFKDSKFLADFVEELNRTEERSNLELVGARDSE